MAESFSVEEKKERDPRQEGFFTKLNRDIDELYEEDKITVNGRSFITHLTSMYWGCRGFPENFEDQGKSVLFNTTLGIESARGTTLRSLLISPWYMKPIFAIISDIFPVAGYKKRWYMCAMSLMGAISAAMIWFSTPDQLGRGTGGTRAFVYLLVINIAISCCDTLSQGKYTEICKWKGSSVVSYVQGSKTAAGMFSSFIGPVINDTKSLGPQTTLGLIAPFLGQAAAVQGANFMGDRKLENGCTPDRAILQKDSKIIATGSTLGIFAFVMIGLSLGGFGNRTLLGTATFGILVALGMCFWSLPYSVAKINVYIIFCRIMVMDFNYVLLQWYTASEAQCGSQTPHFPNTVYQMVGFVTANLMTLLGVYMFEKYVYYWNARRAFWVTTGFTIVASLFDLAMLTQFNRTVYSFLPFMKNKVRWFCGTESCEPDGYRLDDLFGFLMGSQGIKYIATTLDDMPSTVLLSKLCPVGVETTVFAILAALMNLGLQFSGFTAAEFLGFHNVTIGKISLEEYQNTTGALIPCPENTEDVNCYRDDCHLGEGASWTGLNGLQWGLVVGGMILPLFTIPATWLFIPDKALCDNFIDEEEIEPATGAPAHPAAAFAAHSPSFDPLNNRDGEQMATRDELERGSFLSLTRRGNSRLI